jgi:hypothetical protein
MERTAIGTHERSKRALSGVAKWGMADVVYEGESFGKFGVKTERRGNCTGNLNNFQSVREAIAKMIGKAGGEDLRLRLQAAKRTGMDNAVAIAGVIAAVGMLRLWITAPARMRGAHSPRGHFRNCFDKALPLSAAAGS